MVAIGPEHFRTMLDGFHTMDEHFRTAPYGKSVTLDGTPLDAPTGEIVWGEPGTNGQPAFYRLLHQGTLLVPADFLAFAEPNHDLVDMHDLLLANFLAPARALAFGRTAEEVAAEGTPQHVVPHKVMPGNRPSNASWRRD
jgi:glucose-6-phosphate isomerase